MSRFLLFFFQKEDLKKIALASLCCPKIMDKQITVIQEIYQKLVKMAF